MQFFEICERATSKSPRLSELYGVSIDWLLEPFAFSVDPGTTHAHMAALCTSNLGSRRHHLDIVMQLKRFTADRLCEPARKAQATAISKNQLELHYEDEPSYLAIARNMGWIALGICKNEVHLAEYDLIRS